MRFRPRGSAWVALGAVALLAAHAALAISSLRQKSITFDEIAYLVGGASYWAYADHRLNPEAGPLPQRWATAPLRGLGFEPPDRADPAWPDSDPWRLGNRWLYHSSNDPDRIAFAARCMIVAASMALGLLVFSWSRSLWGERAGLVSLTGYALSPTMLAHARLVTSDLAAAALLLAATGALWRAALRATPGRIVVAALAVAALLVTKHSGLLIAPLGVLLIGMAGWAAGPIRWGPRGAHEATSTGERAAVLAAMAALVALGALALIWAAYGFRFAVFAEGAEVARMYRPWDSLVAAGGLPAVAAAWARDLRLLPEAYLYGLAHTAAAGTARRSFLLGEYDLEGFRLFFPVLFAVKTHPALFGIFGIALASGLTSLRVTGARTLALRTGPLLVLLVLYAGFALSSTLNIGHRHLLPLYPVLWILAGSSVWAPDGVGRVRAGLVLASLAWLGVTTVVSWPDYLPYFNRFAGGAEGGYRVAVDSSLDWGQDLRRVPGHLETLEGAEPARTYLAYFGSASPIHASVPARRLAGYWTPDWDRADPHPLTGGIYVVSATMLQNLYTRAPGHWTARSESLYQELREPVRLWLEAHPREPSETPPPDGDPEIERRLALFCDLRFARLAAFLREREPDDRIGVALHVYRLSDAEVLRFTTGPPPPLRETSGFDAGVHEGRARAP